MKAGLQAEALKFLEQYLQAAGVTLTWRHRPMESTRTKLFQVSCPFSGLIYWERIYKIMGNTTFVNMQALARNRKRKKNKQTKTELSCFMPCLSINP